MLLTVSRSKSLRDTFTLASRSLELARETDDSCFARDRRWGWIATFRATAVQLEQVQRREAPRPVREARAAAPAQGCADVKGQGAAFVVMLTPR